MEKNKTRKYVAYAIGEIVLVVIGILIALQISNSNEMRKQVNEEAVILSGIKEDFIATRLNLLETIKQQEKVILRCRDLIDAIETENFSIHPDTIRNRLSFGAFSHHRLEAVLGSYDAVIGSGKTSIIQNQELLSVLADFSALYKSGFEDQEKTDNLFTLMMSTTKDFFPALSGSGFRSGLSLKKRYTLKEKERAVKILYQNESFLAYLIAKTKWERVRLLGQKIMLKSLNRVLYQFNFKELTPEKELYSKYIGNYTNENRSFKISYAEESLYLQINKSEVWELVQVNNTLFSTLTWNAKLEFSSDDRSTTTCMFQFLDKIPFELKKVKD